jgi:raffinose/stachyose/melibiose transport system substrate-binding protein
MSKSYRVPFLGILASMALALTLQVAAQDTPVVVTLWTIAGEADPMSAPLYAAIDRFNAAHTDVQVEFTTITNDDFKTQINIAASAGEVPDLFQTWGGGQLQDFIDAGVVRDIPELTGDVEAKFAPASLSPSTFNGKHYAIPTDLAGVFLWTNTTMFEENNLELPTTWENFIAACKGLSAAGITPVQLGNKDKWPGAFWLIYLVDRIGGNEVFLNSFNRVEGFDFNNPAFIEAGAKIQEAVNANCFEAGYNGNPYDNSLIGAGLAAMQLQGTWNLGGLRVADAELVDKSIRPLPFPAIEGGKGDPSAMVGGTGQAFAVSADAPQEAIDAAIEMFSDPQFGKEVAEAGLLPALVGMDEYITDPIVQTESQALSAASSMQLYYDQFLTPELALVHTQSTQDLFGLLITPEEAAAQMETAAQAQLSAMPTEDMMATAEATEAP